MHPPEPTMNIAPDPPALAKTLNRLADALAVVEDTRTVKQLRQAAALLERMATGADNAQVQSNTLTAEEVREAALREIAKWLPVPPLQLRAGEMSAQEVRLVTAVLSALAATTWSVRIGSAVCRERACEAV